MQKTKAKFNFNPAKAFKSAFTALKRARIAVHTQANQSAFLANMTNPAYQNQLFEFREFLMGGDDVKLKQLGIQMPDECSKKTISLLNNEAYKHHETFALLKKVYNLTRPPELPAAVQSGVPQAATTPKPVISEGTSEIQADEDAATEPSQATSQLPDIKNNILNQRLQKFLKRLPLSDQQLFKAAMINWLDDQPHEFINDLKKNQNNNPLADFLLDIYSQKNEFAKSSKHITPFDKKLARPLFLKFMAKIDVSFAADVDFNHHDKKTFNKKLNSVLSACRVDMSKPAELEANYRLGSIETDSSRKNYSIKQNDQQRMLENAQMHAYLNDANSG